MSTTTRISDHRAAKMETVSDASTAAGAASSDDRPAGSGLRAYGGVDGDARIARRRAALIDAALDVLGSDDSPPDPVTVRGICRATGLNPRYFYESFDGADALVAATFDEVIAELSRSALAAFEAADEVGDRVAGAVGAMVDVIDADRRKGRVLFSPALLSPVVAAKRAESTDLFASLTVRTASGVLDAERSPEAAAVAQFQVGGLGRLLAAWLDGQVPLDRDAVVTLSVRLLLSQVDAVTRRVTP
ncbi:TetR/AcrR family transcriptional regulator [Gordonia sinesedis]